LSFPRDFSLGRLYIKDEYVDSLYIGDAQGEVPVPASEKLYLKIRTDCKVNLKPLSELAPDSLFSLSLANSQIDDAQLEHIGHLSG
ncbi:hypothetical protein, partial [Klebsiella pneumoniae]|uniref:hypothetical protein n=1 Tax=Klebsiella pneumoniae TaxID=573 RepID=UPI003B987503